MLKYHFGGKTGRTFTLKESRELIVVRTTNRMRVTSDDVYAKAALSRDARELLGEFNFFDSFEEAGVEVLRAARARGAKSLRDRARKILKKERDIEFAGRVLTDRRSGVPIYYTENIFVKFHDDISSRACLKIIKNYNRYKLEHRPLKYARNAYFLKAPKGTGQKTFAIAKRLLAEKEVELCHPELLRRRRNREAFQHQWHLKRTRIGRRVVNQHAHVEAAWKLSDGNGTIIAVIDDGVDLRHEEFSSPGKIVAPQDVLNKDGDVQARYSDRHGNACAGVACADGNFGASGVAPRAWLMPIRAKLPLGSELEAAAFAWAADNGADVISCSWGAEDGDPANDSDPLHRHYTPLPDYTQAAIDYATKSGRKGRGCVVVFAAGNGNESVDLDGYASYPGVMAVAACDDTGKKAPYSDYGNAVWCCFPSSNGSPGSPTPGICTTERLGHMGYNPGRPQQQGDVKGNYTNCFGGTSSACPGAAGVAALVISRNPTLSGDQVRDILRDCCDRIDPHGGKYDENGHSPFYGYGRLNARKAVELARPR
jgi:subtilisin family serine protease